MCSSYSLAYFPNYRIGLLLILTLQVLRACIFTVGQIKLARKCKIIQYIRVVTVFISLTLCCIPPVILKHGEESYSVMKEFLKKDPSLCSDDNSMFRATSCLHLLNSNIASRKYGPFKFNDIRKTIKVIQYLI
jgi:hypothetical protein